MVENAAGPGKRNRGAAHRVPPPARHWPVVGLAVMLALALLSLGGQPRTARGEPAAHAATEREPETPLASSRAPRLIPAGTERTLTIAATGDLKGWITTATLDPDRRPTGLAYVAPRIRALRAEDPELILLDAGDALQGAPSATLAGTAVPPIVTLMNALGYDAMALGNVDVSLGWPALDRARAASRFAWLAANVRTPSGGTRLPPYAVLERHGIRVGIVGMTTPAAVLGRDPRRLEGVTFTDVEAAARRWASVLRRVERVDVLIGLFHSGLDSTYDRDVALRAGAPLFAAAGRVAEAGLGFDLIVAGDAQRLSPRTPSGAETPYGTPVVEPGARGNGLAVVTLRLAERDGRWAVQDVRRRTLPAADAPDPAALALEARALRRTRERLAAPTRVRFRAVPRKTEFQRCAGALSHAAAARLTVPSADPARTLSLLPAWRFVAPPRDEVGEPVRLAHLVRWLPFDERLVQGRLTGRQVALLLDGYVRWSRGWRTRPGTVLWPGGLNAPVPPEGSELAGLRRVGGGAPLEPTAHMPVWISAFIWYGGLGLAPRALLPGGPPLREAPARLREALFALLSDPAFALPGPCARWLTPAR